MHTISSYARDLAIYWQQSAACYSAQARAVAAEAFP